MSDSKEISSTDPEIRKMMEFLKKWHDSKIEQLQAVADAKDDTEVQVFSEEDGEEIIIEGDKLTGLKAGCSLAVDLFSPFPIEWTCHLSDEQ